MTSRAPYVFIVALLSCAHGIPENENKPPDAGADVVDPGDGSLTIMQLRDPSAPGHPALGTPVTVRGGVVTDVKAVGNSHGFFMQDRTAQSWAGVYVFVGAAEPSVSTGDLVDVDGTYEVYGGLEELDVRAGIVTPVGVAGRPAPVDVTLNQIEENGSRTMELQSMRVRVSNVVATTDTVGPEFTIGDWSSVATITVTSYMANDVGPSPFPATAGERFVSITGHAYANGLAALAPMSASDVVSM